MNNFKKLSLCVVLINLFLVSAAFSSDHQILQSDTKYNRICKVWSNEIIIRLKPESNTKEILNQVLKSLSADVIYTFLTREESVTNQNPNFLAERKIDQIKLAKIIYTEEPLLRTYHISYPGSDPPELVCKKIMLLNKSVEIAEPVSVDEEQATTLIPNDPLVGQQSLLSLISALDAWGIYQGDTNIVIGVSDGGIYQDHPDLQPNIAPNWKEIPDDGIDNDGNGYIDDYAGFNLAYKDDGTKPGVTVHSSDHGTAVASIAAAKTNNAKGIAGIGFNSRLFPIKTAAMGDNSIRYGYQSILYAGKRGFKVLNCSWGQEKSFSQIDQSVIDYAVANDVAIVAAGGNGNNSIAPYYPAGYFGVLAVGETSLNDVVEGSSTMGAEIDIMAPGENVYVAKNNGGYAIEQIGGTSFASPVVAGVVALVRGKHPNLNNLQALEFTRQCTDDIVNLNPQWETMVRGRINALKAMTIDPMSIPGIKPLKLRFLNSNMVELDRLNSGDDTYLEIPAFNYLGSAANLKMTLSMAYDFSNSIEIINSDVNIASVSANSSFTISKFKIRLLQQETSKVIFRVDITNDKGYHDFFMVPYIPSSEMTTISNGVLTFSVGDRGHIGFAGSNEDRQGLGLLYYGTGSLLYKGGIIASAGTNQVVSSLFSQAYEGCDFGIEKPFVEPDKYTGIINDNAAYAPEKIGLSIKQTFSLSSMSNIAKSVVTIKNISGKNLSDVALGYYFDWDIPPNTDSNIVGAFPEAIPESFKAVAASAEYAQYSGTAPSTVCGCLAFSNNEALEAQAAGMDYATTKSFSKANQLASLSSGQNIQYQKIGDINMIVGMRFPGNTAPNAELNFNFYFGCAKTKTDLAQSFQNALLNLGVEEKTDYPIVGISSFPNPTNNFIQLKLTNISPENMQLSVIDVMGNDVTQKIKSTDNYNFDMSALEPGVYILSITSGKNTVYNKIIKY